MRTDKTAKNINRLINLKKKIIDNSISSINQKKIREINRKLFVLGIEYNIL